MCPKPAPKLTHGETAVVGNKFTRAAGVTKNSLICVGTTAIQVSPAIHILVVVAHHHALPPKSNRSGSRRIGDAYSTLKTQAFPERDGGFGKCGALDSLVADERAAKSAAELVLLVLGNRRRREHGHHEYRTAIQRRLPNISPPAR